MGGESFSENDDTQEPHCLQPGGVRNGDMDELSDFKQRNSTDQVYREYDPTNRECVSASWREGRPPFRHSWYRCIRHSFLITILCGTITAMVLIFVAWLEINMGVICRELNKATWYELPRSIQKAQLTKDVIRGMFIQCWYLWIIFPVFGWRLVKQLNLLTWIILAASFDAILRLLFNVYRTYDRKWMRYPLNFIFAICMLFCSYRIASYYQHTTKQRLQLSFKLGAQFILTLPVALVANHVIAHYFLVIPDKYKAVIASLLPVLFVIPKAVARLCAEKMEGVNHPGTSILFVIILYTTPQMVFRILQAKLERCWMYLILSIVHGIESSFDKITLPLQDYLLKRCCARSHTCLSKQRKPRASRLLADLATVSMIAESSAILVSSAVIQMIRYNSGSDVKAQKNGGENLVKTFFLQAGTGIIIEFLFNIIIIKVQTYYYNIPIIRVWNTKKFWIIGMFFLHSVTGMLYFGGESYGALASKDIFHETVTKNCTAPFLKP